MEYKDKYLKYKQKYLDLKKFNLKKINLKGGNYDISNLKNILVMGAGPVALVNMLALMKRYPYTQNNAQNIIDGNNIFLVGRDLPWRPQIFFLQNSYREYDSADFIRDIDLDTYKILENIGCYIGAPTSTLTPFCFSTINKKGEYTPSSLGEDNTSIRAPSSLNTALPNPSVENIPAFKPLHIMNHLSFQTSDLEVVLLDRILEINKMHIKFYNDMKIDKLDENINNFLRSIESKIFNEEDCSIQLFKALVKKEYLLKNKKISINDFKPLAIVLHPLNKYCNYNSYILFKFYKISESESLIDYTGIKGYSTNPIYSKSAYIEQYRFFLNKSLRREYISDDDIDRTGNYVNNIWEPKKDESGNIYLKYNESANRYDYTNLDFCKKMKICDSSNNLIFINNDDYDIVFESEGGNKQFGRTDDYYSLQNRDSIDLSL